MRWRCCQSGQRNRRTKEGGASEAGIAGACGVSGMGDILMKTVPSHPSYNGLPVASPGLSWLTPRGLATLPPMPLYTVESYGRLQPHVAQEWLLTNGIGGFAMGTVVGCNTRRYHGVLCAATLPPVGRTMALNRVGEVLTLDGADIDDPGARLLELSVNQFRDRFHPRGDQYLRRFHLEDSAVWEYEVEGVRVVKELQVLWERNV